MRSVQFGESGLGFIPRCNSGTQAVSSEQTKGFLHTVHVWDSLPQDAMNPQ